MNLLQNIINWIDEKLHMLVLPLVFIMFLRIFYCIITH